MNVDNTHGNRRVFRLHWRAPKIGHGEQWIAGQIVLSSSRSARGMIKDLRIPHRPTIKSGRCSQSTKRRRVTIHGRSANSLDNVEPYRTMIT